VVVGDTRWLALPGRSHRPERPRQEKIVEELMIEFRFWFNRVLEIKVVSSLLQVPYLVCEYASNGMEWGNIPNCYTGTIT